VGRNWIGDARNLIGEGHLPTRHGKGNVRGPSALSKGVTLPRARKGVRGRRGAKKEIELARELSFYSLSLNLESGEGKITSQSTGRKDRIWLKSDE